MSQSYEFSKDSYYCYEGSDILKNKLKIRDAAILEEKERQLAGLRYLELLQNPPKGEMNFKTLQAIHKYLFQDIYEWAGKMRNVDISKGNMFCNSMFIKDNADLIFAKLKSENYLRDLEGEELIARLAYFFSEINALHPFREGNGRSERAFFTFLVQRMGYMLDFSYTNQDEIIAACVDSFYLKYEKMQKIMRKCLKKI